MVSLRSHLAGRPVRSQLSVLRPVRGFLATAVLCLLALGARGETNTVLLDQWLSAQTNLHTWTADCIQTRSLPVFSQPLVSTGQVWVAMPDHFRWELGQPAQTIALRLPDQLLLIYPRLKRVEKYPLNGAQTGPWKDALALLDASFPRSRAHLESRFVVRSVTKTNSVVCVSLQPKSAFARKFMTDIQVSFRTTDYSPMSTELKFADGSSMRNDFTHSVLNAPLSQDCFDVKYDSGFTVVEPLRQ
jgi:outer membrane lipoprotein-sorting protein